MHNMHASPQNVVYSAISSFYQANKMETENESFLLIINIDLVIHTSRTLNEDHVCEKCHAEPGRRWWHEGVTRVCES